MTKRYIVEIEHGSSPVKRGGVAEARLAASARLCAAVEGVADAIMMTDDAGRVMLANRAVTSIFGYTRDEVVGRNFAALLFRCGSVSAEDEAADFLHVDDGEPFARRRSEWLRKDGSLVLVECTVSETMLDDDRVYVLSARDLGEWRPAIPRFPQWPKECDAVMKELATSMAHELNQPLAAIGLYLTVARRMLSRGQCEQCLDEVLGKAVEQIHRASEVIRNERLLFLNDQTSGSKFSMH